MLNKLHKQSRNPAHMMTIARAKADYKEGYMNWIKGIPNGHIERFLEEGLRPLLKRHGYFISYTPQTLAKACKEWAYAHVRIQQKGSDLYDRFFMKCVHNGGEDEFDWYTHTLPLETWEAFATKWVGPEFLDESDAGYAQNIDLANFAWQTIHLDSSATHIRWKEYIEPSEHDDDYAYSSHVQPTEEAGAYGGDRRTL